MAGPECSVQLVLDLWGIDVILLRLRIDFRLARREQQVDAGSGEFFAVVPKGARITVEIVGGETVRAEDGLALSSRNGYLNAAERAEATQMIATLRTVKAQVAAARSAGQLDQSAVARIEAKASAALNERGWKTDYVLVRRQRDLLLPTDAELSHGEPLVVLAASRLGTTRLIDNLEL